jgi:hypothetical protein
MRGGGVGREGTTGQSIGLAEKGRTDHADGCRQVHIVEDVARVGAERKVVTVIRGRAKAASGLRHFCNTAKQPTRISAANPQGFTICIIAGDRTGTKTLSPE